MDQSLNPQKTVSDSGPQKTTSPQPKVNMKPDRISGATAESRPVVSQEGQARKKKQGSIPTPEPKQLLTPLSQPHFPDTNKYQDRSEGQKNGELNKHSSIQEPQIDQLEKQDKDNSLERPEYATINQRGTNSQLETFQLEGTPQEFMSENTQSYGFKRPNFKQTKQATNQNEQMILADYNQTPSQPEIEDEQNNEYVTSSTLTNQIKERKDFIVRSSMSKDHQPTPSRSQTGKYQTSLGEHKASCFTTNKFRDPSNSANHFSAVASANNRSKIVKTPVMLKTAPRNQQMLDNDYFRSSPDNKNFSQTWQENVFSSTQANSYLDSRPLKKFRKSTKAKTKPLHLSSPQQSADVVSSNQQSNNIPKPLARKPLFLNGEDPMKAVLSKPEIGAQKKFFNVYGKPQGLGDTKLMQSYEQAQAAIALAAAANSQRSSQYQQSVTPSLSKRKGNNSLRADSMSFKQIPAMSGFNTAKAEGLSDQLNAEISPQMKKGSHYKLAQLENNKTTEFASPVDNLTPQDVSNQNLGVVDSNRQDFEGQSPSMDQVVGQGQNILQQTTTSDSYAEGSKIDPVLVGSNFRKSKSKQNAAYQKLGRIQQAVYNTDTSNQMTGDLNKSAMIFNAKKDRKRLQTDIVKMEMRVQMLEKEQEQTEARIQQARLRALNILKTRRDNVEYQRQLNEVRDGQLHENRQKVAARNNVPWLQAAESQDFTQSLNMRAASQFAEGSPELQHTVASNETERLNSIMTSQQQNTSQMNNQDYFSNSGKYQDAPNNCTWTSGSVMIARAAMGQSQMFKHSVTQNYREFLHHEKMRHRRSEDRNLREKQANFRQIEQIHQQLFDAYTNLHFKNNKRANSQKEDILTEEIQQIRQHVAKAKKLEKQENKALKALTEQHARQEEVFENLQKVLYGGVYNSPQYAQKSTDQGYISTLAKQQDTQDDDEIVIQTGYSGVKIREGIKQQGENTPIE